MGDGMRVLVAGWPSFLYGEATAGDVLAMDAVQDALGSAGIACDQAWSPVLRPGGRTLGQARPGRYSHLVFCCGPLHGPQLVGLHRTYAHCRRIAVGVSVTDPADPAALGFHTILARDGAGAVPRRDLAACLSQPAVPVAGVCLAPGQPEYGRRARHDQVTRDLEEWLARQDCARIGLDTRLDPRGWRTQATAAQVEAVVRRVDVMVTTRLHGLVLALKNGVPALAVDPVAGGAKVTAQARAWDWPAVVTTHGRPDPDQLSQQWRWCLSEEAAACARALATGAGPGRNGHGQASLIADLLCTLTSPGWRPGPPGTGGTAHPAPAEAAQPG
jgi:Polysaccharide pyruvyl transferase